MRALLLSDIHANLPALEAVLSHAEQGSARFQAVYNLGDSLGYGPHPREVLERLRDIDARSILGNHEVALLQLHKGERPAGLGTGTQVLAWQLGRLSRRDLEDIARWKEARDVPELGARLRHGTPLGLDIYLSAASAREAFAQWNGDLAFAGHTHVPAIYAALRGAAENPVTDRLRVQPVTLPPSRDHFTYLLPPRARLIINVGSVGQPRDGDPRASYGVYDTERRRVDIYRVPYPTEQTQADLRAAGLPETLALRLAQGR